MDTRVSLYDKVSSLQQRLKSAPRVGTLKYEGGSPTGRECDAYHYHGYRGIEAAVVKDISDWIKG